MRRPGFGDLGRTQREVAKDGIGFGKIGDFHIKLYERALLIKKDECLYAQALVCGPKGFEDGAYGGLLLETALTGNQMALVPVALLDNFIPDTDRGSEEVTFELVRRLQKEVQEALDVAELQVYEV